MPRPPEAREPLDVQVHQVAGRLMLVALHRRLGIQNLEPVQTQRLDVTRHAVTKARGPFRVERATHL
jgi:hypothetical protein